MPMGQSLEQAAAYVILATNRLGDMTAQLVR